MGKINPGLIISTLGIIGLLITFVETSGELGSKIPIAIFFLAITIIGICFIIYFQGSHDNTYGEFAGKGGIS